MVDHKHIIAEARREALSKGVEIGAALNALVNDGYIRMRVHVSAQNALDGDDVQRFVLESEKRETDSGLFDLGGVDDDVLARRASAQRRKAPRCQGSADQHCERAPRQHRRPGAKPGIDGHIESSRSFLHVGHP